MGKLPWFKFYPSSWLTDTELGRCSKATKGVWIDMLSQMFNAPVRGVLADADGTAWSDEEVSRLIGGNTTENVACIGELLGKGVASRNKRGAIFSRRMVADETERQGSRERMSRMRAKDVTPDVTPPVTVMSQKPLTSNFLSSEVIYSSSLKPKDRTDELVERILARHPSNWIKTGKLAFFPPVQEYAVMSAVARDGPEVVEQGNENYAKAVEKWPMHERKMVLSAVRFFNESKYLVDPLTWEKGNASSNKVREGFDIIDRVFKDAGQEDSGRLSNGATAGGDDK